MVDWNDQDQAQDTLWNEHKEIDDHIVPQPKECNGNSFSKFGRYSKKQKQEVDCNTISSAIATKNDFLSCNVKYSSGLNINQELNYPSVEMDTWPDLPNLSMTFDGGFNDVIVQNSVVTGFVSDVADATDMNSVGGFFDSSSLSKTSILLSGNGMQLDGEPELFCHDDSESDKFLDYNWANIEDFSDLDKMFRNNDTLFGNEMIDSADTFLTSSADLISSTSQSIPVLDLPVSGEQAWEESSFSYQLGEHSIAKVNPLQKGNADSSNQTLKTMKNDGEKVGFSQGLNNSWNNKNQQIPKPSALNPIQTRQSQSIEQPSSSHHPMFADYGHPAYQFHGLPLPTQIHAGKNLNKPAYPDFSKHRKASASKQLTMTPQEKIEKLRRRQQMQAMLAIQKQREQYNHQISCSDVTDNSQKLPSSDSSSLAEQDQSQMISSSLDGRSVEEAIYYQLQDAMGKLDMNVRLSIRDSLYRLARSAMERQNVSDGSSSSKSNKEEDEISADGESETEDRYSRLTYSEAVTNPIDRIVAHLLFHNPSVSTLMPIADGDVSMAASM